MTFQFPKTPKQLTKAESLILDYVSNHTEAFLFSSIGQLAKQLGVSEATVSRCVRHVGCKNFKEFKQLVIRQASIEGPAAKIVSAVSEDGTFSLCEWMSRQQQYINKTLEGIDPDNFDRAAKAIMAAKRVFIHAKSASSSIAQLLMFRLRRLGIDASLFPSGGSEVVEGIAQAQPEDLIVMFSFSKVSTEAKMILSCRKDIGYSTLSFTGRSYIPEEEKSDINIFVYRGEPDEYHSMAAPAAVVDALVVAVSEKMGASSVEKLSHLHELKKKYKSVKA